MWHTQPQNPRPRTSIEPKIKITIIEAATALTWKLLQVAEQTFRRLNAPELLPAVYADTQYVDGVRNHRAARQEVAA
jgi:hypothetical protein